MTTIAAGGTGACSMAEGGSRCCCTYPVDPVGIGIANGDESGLGFNSATIDVCAQTVTTTIAAAATTADTTATTAATLAETPLPGGKINSGGPDEAAGSKDIVGGADTNATGDGGGDGAGGGSEGGRLLAIILPLLALLMLAVTIMFVLYRRKQRTADYAEPVTHNEDYTDTPPIPSRTPRGTAAANANSSSSINNKGNSDSVPQNAKQPALDDAQKSNVKPGSRPTGISLRGTSSRYQTEHNHCIVVSRKRCCGV